MILLPEVVDGLNDVRLQRRVYESYRGFIYGVALAGAIGVVVALV